MIRKCPVCGDGYGPETFCRCMRRKWRFAVAVLFFIVLGVVCSWANRNSAPPAKVNISLLRAEEKSRAAKMLKANEDDVLSMYYGKGR